MRRVAVTSHATFPAGGHHGTLAELVATVTLGAVFSAEVREPFTERGTGPERHITIDKSLARQCADIRALRLATIPGVVADYERLRGTGGCVRVIEVQSVASTTVLGWISCTGRVAVSQIRLVTRGGKDVTAVAFTSVFRSEVMVILAEVGARLERDVSCGGFCVESSHAITLSPAALKRVGRDGRLVRRGNGRCWDHRGRRGRVNEPVHLESVAATAVLSLIAGTNHVAIRVVGHVAPGVDELAAVAFAAELSSKISEDSAVRCTQLQGHGFARKGTSGERTARELLVTADT